MSNDDTPAPAPGSIPWYKSAVLRGILVTLVSQVLARIAAKYHIDLAALSSAGINADAITQMALDGISALALAYAAHGRVAKPMPAVTLTQKQADTANGTTTPPAPPAPPAK